MIASAETNAVARVRVDKEESNIESVAEGGVVETGAALCSGEGVCVSGKDMDGNEEVREDATCSHLCDSSPVSCWDGGLVERLPLEEDSGCEDLVGIRVRPGHREVKGRNSDEHTCFSGSPATRSRESATLGELVLGCNPVPESEDSEVTLLDVFCGTFSHSPDA